MNYFRIAISILYDAVSAPIVATRDALAEKLQNVRDTITLLYNRTKEKLEYGQTTTLHDNLEEEKRQYYVGLQDIKDLYGREKETGGISDEIEDM